jgi:putative NIF3 family GTP cyclohydrolase 1 type 2
MTMRISRRQFALTAAASLAAAEPLTAEAIIRRTQSELGGEWPATGPDGLKAGDPTTVVKGIATTAMATIDVLKEAAKTNANLIVTYEPTFYGRAEGGRADDPVLKAKRDFIEKNGLVVFRLRDHWQARMTPPLAAALGWSNGRDALYDVPAATAEETVDQVRRRLNIRGGLRAVGDRKATIRRVLVHPGSMTPAIMWQRYGEVDMVIAGEVREWENTFYAADIFTAGEKRVLVTVGRVVSEDPGMRACADWFKTVVKEVPSRWIAAGDPYWRPV